MNCGIDLFLTYKEFRTCQEFFIVLLAFFLPFGCFSPICLLPVGVKNVFLGCVCYQGLVPHLSAAGQY